MKLLEQNDNELVLLAKEHNEAAIIFFIKNTNL